MLNRERRCCGCFFSDGRKKAVEILDIDQPKRRGGRVERPVLPYHKEINYIALVVSYLESYRKIVQKSLKSYCTSFLRRFSHDLWYDSRYDKSYSTKNSNIKFLWRVEEPLNF